VAVGLDDEHLVLETFVVVRSTILTATRAAAISDEVKANERIFDPAVVSLGSVPMLASAPPSSESVTSPAANVVPLT
jgi:hypothetical protein